MKGFNTQPRGGGCSYAKDGSPRFNVFQHTAARRRLPYVGIPGSGKSYVSTHSRAEAAADGRGVVGRVSVVSTHSRAEAAALVSD